MEDRYSEPPLLYSHSSIGGAHDAFRAQRSNIGYGSGAYGGRAMSFGGGLLP